MLFAKIFDNVKREPFNFKPVGGTKYFKLKPSDCDLFNDFELRPIQKGMLFKKQSLGVVDGVIIMYADDKRSIKEATPQMHLDINYAYLSIEKLRDKITGR